MKAELELGCVMVLWMALWLLIGAWLANRFPGRKDVVVMLLLPVFMMATAIFFAMAIPMTLNSFE